MGGMEIHCMYAVHGDRTSSTFSDVALNLLFNYTAVLLPSNLFHLAFGASIIKLMLHDLMLHFELKVAYFDYFKKSSLLPKMLCFR